MPEIFTHPTRGPNSRQSGNRLLDTLDSTHLADLLSHSSAVKLDLAQIVHQPDISFEHIYFPTSGVISIFCIMPDGRQVEVSAIGREGLVGSCLALGVDRTPARAMVQVQGSAIRMKAEDFTAAIARDEGLHALLGRYIQSLLVHSSQAVACNRLHTLDQRFASFLLQVSDFMNSDQFALTQEFMSQMLMVRRASVSAAASAMQREGLVTYSRGKVRVVDRAGLEAASCGCYQAVRREYTRLLG